MKNVNNANSTVPNSIPVQKQNTDEEKDKDYEVIRVILQHDRNPELFDWFEQLSQANKKLYNSLLYVARQVFFYHSDAKARKKAEEKEKKAKAANSASQAAQGSGTQNKSQNPAKSKAEKPYVPRVWNEGQLEVFKNMDQIIQETGKPFSCFSQKSMEKYMTRFLVTSDTDILPSQSRQQTRKRVVEDMNNWMKSIRAYRKNPKAFNNVSPKLPGYKKSDRTFFTFTNQQCHFKDGKLCFPAKHQMKMSWQPSNFEKLVRVEVHPWYNAFKICIVYEPIKNIPEEKPFNPAAIDLGVNCLAAVVEKSSCLICNGRPLKSELQYYNKKMAHLHREYDGWKTIHNDRLPRDKDGKIIDPSQKLPGLTKQMIHDIQKRDNVIRNYLHQVSRKIVNWCVERNVTHIIIGHNKGWKDECLMKNPQKQNFRYVPFNTLIDMITYKAKREGIEVIITEESYTSYINLSDILTLVIFVLFKVYFKFIGCYILYLSPQSLLIDLLSVSQFFFNPLGFNIIEADNACFFSSSFRSR